MQLQRTLSVVAAGGDCGCDENSGILLLYPLNESRFSRVHDMLESVSRTTPGKLRVQSLVYQTVSDSSALVAMGSHGTIIASHSDVLAWLPLTCPSSQDRLVIVVRGEHVASDAADPLREAATASGWRWREALWNEIASPEFGKELLEERWNAVGG